MRAACTDTRALAPAVSVPAVLLANRWFASLPAPLQQALVAHTAQWSVEAGQAIGRQGAVPDVWFAVTAGAVKLVGHDDEGEQVVLDLLEPGQWFGSGPLLARQPQPYWVEALVASKLLTMRGSVLRQLQQVHPELASALAQLNWHAMERLMQRLQVVSAGSLEDKLGRVLATLARRFGCTADDDYCRIRLRLNQGELASLVRASRQRVNHLIMELLRRGELRRRDGYLEVRSARFASFG